MERVVITGIGAVTPIGNTAQEYWDGLLAGKNGIAPITLFDPEGYKASVAGEVKDFDPTAYIDKREVKHMDRFCQFALAAAAQAMEQAGLTEGSFDPFRAGTLVGSGIGGIQTFSEEQTKLNERGARRVSPFCIPMMIGNMAAAHISMAYGLKGSSLSAAITQPREAEVYPGLVRQMIRAGEEAGKLAEMLRPIVDFYEDQAKALLRRTMDMMTPAMIILLGCMIGPVIIGVYKTLIILSKSAAS